MQQQVQGAEKWGPRVLKIALGVIGVLAVGALAAHFGWKYSGDDEPRLVYDEQGIKIWEIKTPGSTIKKIKAERRVQTTLTRAVAAMMDGSLKNCTDWNRNCYVSESVEPWDPATESYVHLWTQYVDPFAPREFLLRTTVTQEQDTQATTVKFSAEPEALPPSDCCFRLSHMESRWRFTPQGDGELLVQLLMDIDIGLPYVLFNMEAAGSVLITFEDLPTLFNKPEYDDWDHEWLARGSR